MPRSLFVLPADTVFKVHPPFGGEVLYESASAAECLEWAVRASDGGEVALDCGVYPLDRPVELAHQTHLVGKGRGTCLLVTAENGEGVGLVATGVNGARVGNLSVAAGHGGAVEGIRFDGCGDCRIVDVYATGFRDFGLVLRNHCFLCEIRGCQLSDNRAAGILLQNLLKGRVGDYIQNSVSDCLVYGGGDGVRCDRATVVNITGCSVFQANGAGYRLIGSNSVLISGCRTFQITGCAVDAGQSHEFNASGNIFCWHTEDGIHLRECRWGTIGSNEVIDTGSFNPDVPDQSMRFDELPPIEGRVGIRLDDTRGFSVTGNTVFNWPQGCRMRCGITEDAASEYNLISGNNVNYFSEAAVVAEGSNGTVGENISRGPDPHYSAADFPYIQSFEPHRLKGFIDAQRARLLS